MSPMKPIGPAAETTAAVAIEPPMKQFLCTEATSTPCPRAISSPRDMWLRLRRCRVISAIAAITRGIMVYAKSNPTVSSLPIVHLSSDTSRCGLVRYLISIMNAPHMMLIVTPARSMVYIDRPVFVRDVM